MMKLLKSKWTWAGFGFLLLIGGTYAFLLRPDCDFRPDVIVPCRCSETFGANTNTKRMEHYRFDGEYPEHWPKYLRVPDNAFLIKRHHIRSFNAGFNPCIYVPPEPLRKYQVSGITTSNLEEAMQQILPNDVGGVEQVHASYRLRSGEHIEDAELNDLPNGISSMHIDLNGRIFKGEAKHATTSISLESGEGLNCPYTYFSIEYYFRASLEDQSKSAETDRSN